MLITSDCRNQDKFCPHGPFGSYADIALLQDMKFYGASEIHFDALV